MYLLDTDTLTHLQANHPRVVGHLREEPGAVVAITVITRIEMLQGRFDFLRKAADQHQLLRAQELLTRTEARLSEVLTIPIDSLAAAHWARLRTLRGLKKVGRSDLLIASIALAHRATLVTRNVRHFRGVPNLDIVNWVD